VKRIVLVLATPVLVLGWAWFPCSSSAQTPGTLVGETLQATPASGYDTGGNCLDPGQCVQVTGTCDASGNSTATFTATGTAVGPYPGTFTASGTVVFGPLTLPGVGVVPSPAGPNLTLTETFTIQSGTTTITGTKQLAADVIPFVSGTGLGSCNALPGGDAYVDAASATYTATITDESGSHTETGNTYVNFTRSSTTDCGVGPVCNYGNFAQAFYTATTEPTTTTTSPPTSTSTSTTMSTSSTSTSSPSTTVASTTTTLPPTTTTVAPPPTTACKPGYGYGDKNHCHTRPPGQTSKST
jgi:hypothetical protein